MDNNNGGLSSAERQRKTAAELARQKVLAAYSGKKKLEPISKTLQPASPATPTQVVQSSPAEPKPTIVASKPVENKTINPETTKSEEQMTSNMKQHPIQTTVKKEDWRAYHTAWQDYYQKYYSEYYARAARQYLETNKLKAARAAEDEKKLLGKQAGQTPPPIEPTSEEQSVASVLKATIWKKATENAKNSRRHRHLIPIIAGVVVVLLILFAQYNRLIFAPIMAYVAPGSTSDDGIEAIDPTINKTVSANPTLIIPKLNVEVPINFGISNDSKTVMDAMNHGVAQFSIPGANAYPGEIGNLVITGHSAGDIYSNNQYKFIFSGLERLTPGDLIYVDYLSVRYTYSVTHSNIVEPSDVNSLVTETTKPMLTLVTCTPLGTSRYRLLVFADQIDPAPDAAKKQSDDISTASAELPNNEPSFFRRIWNFLTGKNND